MTPFRVYTTDECGPDGYPLAWHTITGYPLAVGIGVKDLVREQAGNRCQRCGHPYVKGAGEWSACDERCMHVGPMRGVFADGRRTPAWLHVDTLNDPDLVGREAQWRILTVHHLTGVKADLRWWNLAALCQRCHLQVQRRVVMDRPWPWPHTEWFQVHAAAWYSLKYEGRELDRDEALEHLDNLLKMGARHESVERMAL
jgi:hypothetical protein